MNPQDPLFKGCTRPAMFFGVPLVPLMGVTMFIAIIAVLTNFFLFFAVIPIVGVMRLITKNDDQMFRLLWLRFLFRAGYYFKNGRFWHASAYSPVKFKKRRW